MRWPRLKTNVLWCFQGYTAIMASLAWKRDKLIKIADAFLAGWAAVKKYKTDTVTQWLWRQEGLKRAEKEQWKNKGVLGTTVTSTKNMSHESATISRKYRIYGRQHSLYRNSVNKFRDKCLRSGVWILENWIFQKANKNILNISERLAIKISSIFPSL